ncbi:hypothetical protein MMC13_004425 [Lambiella insularis]|nr:hypothetical protein [Lambiella insularis]
MNPKASFLHLPPQLRCEIYKLSGLVRPCPIDISIECKRKRMVESFLNLQSLPEPRQESWLRCDINTNLGCFCEAIPLQLLTTCRSVYDEALPILYGRNIFKVTYSLLACRLIENLGSSALAALTVIQLDLGDVDLGVESSGKEKDIDVLFGVLSTHFTQPMLSLTLTCELVCWGKLEVVRQPLGRFRDLTSCTIRLSRTADGRRKKAARRMVLDATNHVADTTGFPIMALPKEIRYHVLQFTDLVFQWRVGASSHDRFLLATEARQVFFSENRFIFTGNPEKTLDFLRGQSREMINCIRKIDFLIYPVDFGMRAGPAYLTPGRMSSWRALMKFLAANFNIPNLFLSIDGAVKDEVMHFPRTLYTGRPPYLFRTLIEPLREDKRFQRLRQFHVFWDLCHRYEAQAEEEVKGRGCDSALEGKIHYRNRHPSFPHGIPSSHPSFGNDTMVGY